MSVKLRFSLQSTFSCPGKVTGKKEAPGNAGGFFLFQVGKWSRIAQGSWRRWSSASSSRTLASASRRAARSAANMDSESSPVLKTSRNYTTSCQGFNAALCAMITSLRLPGGQSPAFGLGNQSPRDTFGGWHESYGMPLLPGPAVHLQSCRPGRAARPTARNIAP